jgi:hypothetical protein
MNLKSLLMLGGVSGVANLSHPREQGSKPRLERRPISNSHVFSLECTFTSKIFHNYYIYTVNLTFLL